MWEDFCNVQALLLQVTMPGLKETTQHTECVSLHPVADLFYNFALIFTALSKFFSPCLFTIQKVNNLHACGGQEMSCVFMYVPEFLLRYQGKLIF